MSHPLHHLHKRMRASGEALHPYPAKSRTIRFVDGMIYVTGVLGPFASLPQLIEIWVHKNAAGVSAFSWTGYTIGTVLWLIYGVVHREKPIIITQVLWLVFNVLITIGAFIY
jgi:MtN3 and saliva related transmembrane protein